MGAATFDITGHERLGRQMVVKGNLTFSSSYATGGDSLALASEVGLKEVTSMLVADNDTGLSFDLDPTNVSAPKVKAYSAAATEVANATNQATVTVPVWLFGS